MLLTDLELPGVHGRAVIDYALRQRPALRVVMISAHLPDANWPLVGDPRLSILPKPFTLAQLADEVRRVSGPPLTGCAGGRELLKLRAYSRSPAGPEVSVRTSSACRSVPVLLKICLRCLRTVS